MYKHENKEQPRHDGWLVRLETLMIHKYQRALWNRNAKTNQKEMQIFMNDCERNVQQEHADASSSKCQLKVWSE